LGTIQSESGSTVPKFATNPIRTGIRNIGNRVIVSSYYTSQTFDG
jgi:hypothetical protein